MNNSKILSKVCNIEADVNSLSTGISIIGTVDSNLIEILGNPVDTNSGNTSAQTQRITISTDDINLASINTNSTNITSAYNSSLCDTNIVQVGGSAISQSSGIQNVNVLSSLNPTPEDSVNLRAGNVSGFESATIRCYSDGLGTSNSETFFGDGYLQGENFDYNIAQHAINSTQIGGANIDQSANILIEYFEDATTNTLSVAVHTFDSTPVTGNDLNFAWFRIQRMSLLRTGTNPITQNVHIGQNFGGATGKPTIFMHSMAPLVNKSRCGIYYIRPEATAYLKHVQISSASTVLGGVYKLHIYVYPDDNIDFRREVATVLISNTISKYDLSDLPPIIGGGTILCNIERFEGTNNKAQSCTISLILEVP